MNIQMTDIFIRLGWAFLCGLCIFMVPLLLRRAFHAETPAGRVVAAFLAVLFFAAFCTLSVYLWKNYVPEPPPAPESPSALPP